MAKFDRTKSHASIATIGGKCDKLKKTTIAALKKTKYAEFVDLPKTKKNNRRNG